MCGIVGHSGTSRPGDRELFIALCREACIRGVHAFGFAYITPEGALECRKALDFDALMWKLPEILPHKIIFHNRYSTSGDFREMANNQPIVRDGAALVFNGTVDMGTKEEMERRHDVSLTTDNDGELVLIDCLSNNDPFRRLRDDKATYAGIFLHPRRMYAFRNALRPLWCFDDQDNKFITSTLDIATRAKLDKNNGHQVTPYELLYL